MPCILTVDDSATIRSIVTKQMTELGYEVEQAEDGERGLAKLEEITPDVILLDVTMPVMDGPTMLAKLRQSGNRTPVIMLTSESKRTIVAGAIKEGIDDYILKPFKPDELKAKVLKAIGKAAPASTGAAAEAPAPTAGPAAAAGSRQFVDILVIDDMENVHKKLRGMLPAHVSMKGCVSARDALQLAQDGVFRVVLVDLVIPDVNSVALAGQLRALQPHAVVVALALRTANDAAAEAKGHGFADIVFKPFEAAAVDEFLAKHFEVDDALTVDGNALTCVAFTGKEEKLDRYFTRLKTSFREALEKLASACHEDAIVDLTAIPIRGDRIARLMIEAEKEATKLGIALRLVGNAEVKRALSAVVETAALPFFPSRAEAAA